jgi:glycosyltransferase involved in cell wall biosynthesis
MRLSFVIPTRNQAPFIAKCLESCLAQGVADAEIVVMDGCSTDGTVEILRGYGERIRWRSEVDAGQSDALVKAVRASSGEVIAWINSDDHYARPDVLGRVLAAFADPAVDIVYGNALLVDVQGKAIRPLPARPDLDARAILLHPSSPLSQPAVFFRRRLWDEVGGVDRALHFTMDYELWIRMFQRARRTVYLDDVLACATSHEAAKSIAGMRQQIAETGKVKRRYASAFRLSPAELLRLWRGMAELYAYWAAVNLGLKRAV